MISEQEPSATSIVPRELRRNILQEHLPEWIALSIYLGLVALILPHHEPVADEAQAWQLARSLPIGALFHALRYEGTPGLWYLLLWILSRAQVSYAGLHWICAAIASVGAAILVFRAPFPRYIKLLLPFTYFLAFQYAIVARSYVLFPPLVFALAASWRYAWKRPWTIALLLGLMANISLHCAVISGGFAIVYAMEALKRGEARSEKGPGHGQFVGAASMLLVLYGLVVWTAWPAQDLWMASHIQENASTSSGGGSSNQAAPQTTIHTTALRTSVLRTSARDVLIGGLGASVLGIATPYVMGIPFWIAVIWYFARRGQVYLMTPLALFVLFSAVSAFAFWHSGLLAVSLIAVFWISLSRQAHGTAADPAFPRIVVALLLYAIGMQIAWTADAMHFDYKYPYSPDLAASKFLRPYVDANARIAVTYSRQTGISAYDAVGLLPYFEHNIYMNVKQPFWVWSTRNTTEAEFWRDLPSKPDLVIVEFNESARYNPLLDAENPRLRMLAAAGYSHTQTFCGAKLAQFTVFEYTCHLIFEQSKN